MDLTLSPARPSGAITLLLVDRSLRIGGVLKSLAVQVVLKRTGKIPFTYEEDLAL
jgi:hypothetical protein